MLVKILENSQKGLESKTGGAFLEPPLSNKDVKVKCIEEDEEVPPSSGEEVFKVIINLLTAKMEKL